MRFWVGGYTSDMNGNAAGIGVLLAGGADEASASGPLTFEGTAVAAPSPSWLTAHPTLDVVYAALEGDGAVRAYRRNGPSAFAPLGSAQPAGVTTCHVAVSPDGRWLTASSYGDGAVARMRLDADGVPSAAEFGVAATDPYAAGGSATPTPDLGGLAGGVELDTALAALRAAAGEFAHLVPETTPAPPAPSPADDVPERVSRAHQARYLPGGLVATTDLGFDLVRFWRDGRLVQEVVLPFGSGPRHMVWHPSGHLYVLTEYSCEVFAIAPDASGRWRIITAAQVSREAVVGADFPAELSLSPDDSHLYAGVRGINAIATLRVRGEGDRLESVATVDAQVDWPRHQVPVGDSLFIAGQRSDEVASLAIDARTQIPGRRLRIAHVPSPTVLLPSFD